MPLSDLSLDPGIEQLDWVAELAFTVTSGRTRRSWTWAPATQRATAALPDGRFVSFTFGHPEDDEQDALDALFAADHFWLLPQLHARWAADYVFDQGTATFAGRAVRWVQLRYPREAGGRTPGDTHDLYVDRTGAIVGWGLHPGGQPAATVTATFEGYGPLGPLSVARTRRLVGGDVVTVSGLDWSPVGVSVSVDPGGLGAFVYLTSDRCHLGPLVVARKAPAAGRAVSLPADATVWNRQMVLRDGPERSAHRWSADALRVEDASWLADAGFFGCDLWTVDEDAMRAALAAVAPADRAALLTLVTEWTLATVPVPGALRPVAQQVHRAARTCADEGACEGLVSWLRRIR